MPHQAAAHLRKQARPLSDKAKALRQDATTFKAQATEQALAAAELLNKRMPVEFGSWGIMKTRAYAKLLGVLIAQTRRVHPNLPLANMSTCQDLLTQRDELNNRIANERTRLRTEALATIKDLCTAYGITATEIFSARAHGAAQQDRAQVSRPRYRRDLDRPRQGADVDPWQERASFIMLTPEA